MATTCNIIAIKPDIILPFKSIDKPGIVIASSNMVSYFKNNKS